MVLYESSHGAGNASEDEQKENSKKLATGNFFTRYGEKVLDKMKST